MVETMREAAGWDRCAGDLPSRVCEEGMANGDCGIQYISKPPARYGEG